VHHLMRPLERVTLSIKFQYIENERCVRYMTDRPTNITKQSIFADETYSKIRAEWDTARFDLQYHRAHAQRWSVAVSTFPPDKDNETLLCINNQGW